MLIFYQSSMPLKTILALEGSRLGDGGQKSCVIGVKIFIFNQQINSLPRGNSSVDQMGGGGRGGEDRGVRTPLENHKLYGFL